MRIGLLTAGCMLLAAGSALAQAPTGPQFRVDTGSVMGQSAVVAADPLGNFVIVWTAGSPSYFPAVTGRRFDANGAPRGSEFQISATPAHQFAPHKVATRGDGGFVVAWQGWGPDPYDILMRRYEASGLPQAGEMLVNSYTPGAQVYPSLASDAAGNMIVVWASNHEGDDFGIYAQQFDGAGARLGGEFQVNSSTTGRQYQNAVAMDASGNFVVVWESRQDSVTGIFGQRFTAGGTRLGGEFQVNTPSPGMHIKPSVAAAANGEFVVAWAYRYGGYRILARLFDANGAPRGAELSVNPAGVVDEPEVAMGPSGAFWVVWEESAASGWDVRGRRFDADGRPQSRAFALSAPNTVSGPPAAAFDGLGNVIATWVGSYSGIVGIYAQRFGLLEPFALTSDTVAGPLSDGNRVLEPGETVDVRVVWKNNAAATYTLSGTITQISGPPGATYAVPDSVASYGSVAPGSTAACTDCYAVFVSNPAARPAVHWDARVTEVINPGDDAHIDWTLHVGDSFADVPRGSGFYRFIETLLHHSVAAGCANDAFCPAAPVTREQMAPMVLVAREGAGYTPQTCGIALFADVPAASPFCRFIEELARRGVVSGCGPGLYCPTAAVTREQMAVFVLRTLDPALNPPACTAGAEAFADVPASSPFCRWIEELARRGVVTGCGGGNYCPAAAVTREQMSVFLTVTFGLTLYGP